MTTLKHRDIHIGKFFHCVLLFLTSCISSLPVSAQIVYSARYYYPPSAHRFSYYHIYLLNLNTNRRMQITSGRWDDFDACYSPNGRYIAFDRIKQQDHVYYEEYLCVYSMKLHKVIAIQKENLKTVSDTFCWNSNGSAVAFTDCKPLIIFPKLYSKGFFFFNEDTSPDGQYTIKWKTLDDRTMEIWHLGGKSPVLQISSEHRLTPFWDEDGQLYCYLLMHPKGQRIELDHIDLTTTPPSQKTVLVHLAPNDPLKKWFQFDGDQYFTAFGDGSGVPGYTILTQDFSNSSQHELAFFMVNAHTGLCKFLCYASVLSFSPDRKQFVTLTKQWLAPYGKHRALWVTRLILHSAVHKTSRVLIEGLVDVESASWLKGYDISICFA